MLAIAAIAPHRGHALLIGPEAAVASAAAAAAVVRAPRVGDVIGADRLALAGDAEQAQRQHGQNASHRNTSHLHSRSINELAAPWLRRATAVSVPVLSHARRR